MKKKAIIYCRDAIAEPVKVTQQETECECFAKKKGYEVVQTFHDYGYSGVNTNRPAFQRMLTVLQGASEPYTVIAMSIDRVSRNIGDLISINQTIGGLGSELVFTAD